MGKNADIEWCDHTKNIWVGCLKVHKGCDNCYAEAMANRFTPGLWGAKTPRMIVNSFFKDIEKWNKQAAKANQKHKVFVGSMMDVFEKSMPIVDRKHNTTQLTTGELRDKFFEQYVCQTPNLFYQLLTKRPSNINKFIPENWKDYPPRNVIFGTSIVDQETTDKLLPQLKQVKGYKFLSIEPQLGAIEDIDLNGIDWVIQGGESGHSRRPFDLDWAYDMKEKCEKANVPYFFKQIDKVLPIPTDLQIKQFPKFML